MRKQAYSRLLSVLATVCAVGGSLTANPGADNGDPARDALRAELVIFEGYVREQARAAFEAIVRVEPGKEPEAEDWRRRFRGSVRRALRNDDPVAALLDAWALAAQMRHYLSDGEGRGKFGRGQALALEVAAGIDEYVESIAREVLSDEAFGEVEPSIREYALTRPYKTRTPFFRKWFGWLRFPFRDELFTVFDTGKDTLQAIAGAPLSPATSDIRRGADELHSVGITADRFTDAFEEFPRRMREELETLIEGLAEHSEDFARTAEDLRFAAEAANEAVKGADPLTLRAGEIVGAMDAAAPTIQGSAASIGDAADRGAELVKAIEALVRAMDADGAASRAEGSEPFDPREYAQAADAIGAGADQVRLMLDEIRALTAPDPDPRPVDERGRPFDVREYAEAARAIQDGAAEVRAGLADVRTLVRDSDSTSTAAVAAAREHFTFAVGDAAAETRAVVDHIAWRAAQLLILAFVLALAFVLLRRLFTPRAR